jgi:hypothetical protein
MLSKSIEKLLTQLADGLGDVAGQKLSLEKRLSKALQLIRNLINSLREQVFLQPFKDKPEEIYFFKNVKTIFLSAKIFELELYNLEQNKPVGSLETLCTYYESELEIIRRFFKQYAYLYQYYRTGMTEMDNLYFVRGAEVPTILIPEFGEPDQEFSTYGDYLFAKFKAYESLQDYILKNLARLNPTVFTNPNPTEELSELKWTGDKVNLVEVIYALYFTGQLNNGNADIAQIIHFMEKHLQIDLSRSYRDFIDIRNRKVSSPTRYIDQMRESIHKRVDDDLALKKSKRERFKSGS